MRLITLLTDFGLGRYVGTMKGVILSINPTARVVDIDHTIGPQNIVQGAFVLAAAVPYFADAVHVAVVDPGVGGARRPVAVACENGLLVGPDNGLLYPAAQALGLGPAYEIVDVAYTFPDVSSTFHGRDVFAPVAAHLSRGVSPEALGPPVKDLVPLDFGSYSVTSEEVRGTVLFEDRFGNLITNVPGEALPEWVTPKEAFELDVGHRHLLPFLENYAEGEPGKGLLLVSSDGHLEIAESQGRASVTLDLRAGQTFVLRSAPRKG